MVERKILIDQARLQYEGLLDVNEFYKMTDFWFREKGYDKWEWKNYEHVYKSGKQVELEITPWKKVTDYLKIVMRVQFLMKNIKDVVVTKDGVKVKLQQGSVLAVFTTYMESDYEHRWEAQPIFYFLHQLFDHYVFKINTERYEAQAVKETNEIRDLMKSYLNLFRF
ncbi:hypothetical protein JXB02_04415 [Candidatus Woesearchaeota archaeon]|nr:hypothetical protein [Candidatus Woesearchaeota archaeon]